MELGLCGPSLTEEFSEGTVHFSGVQYISVQNNTVQLSTVQYSTVQINSVQYSTVQCRAVQYSSVQNNTVKLSAVQYSTVQTSVRMGCIACDLATEETLEYMAQNRTL